MKELELNLSLNSYLLRLKATELEKPPSKRRRVPTITDFAKNAHVSRATMHRLTTSSDSVVRVNLKIMSSVLTTLNKAGFTPNVSDLWMIREAESDEEVSVE